MDGFLTREEHNEFAKRIDAENARQNARLDILENTVRGLAELPIIVKAIKENQEKSMEATSKALDKIQALEQRPVTTFNGVKQALLNAIASAVAALFVSGIAAIIVYGIVNK